MKKMLNKQFIITTLICLLTIPEGLIFYNRLPENMATHFNLKGVADGYSDKNFAIFFLPLIFTALNFFIALSLEYSEKGKSRSKLYKSIYRWLSPILAVIMQTGTILYSLNINIIPVVIIFIIIYILILIFASIRKEDKK